VDYSEKLLTTGLGRLYQRSRLHQSVTTAVGSPYGHDPGPASRAATTGAFTPKFRFALPAVWLLATHSATMLKRNRGPCEFCIRLRLRAQPELCRCLFSIGRSRPVKLTITTTHILGCSEAVNSAMIATVWVAGTEAWSTPCASRSKSRPL
jgi:hypothetical protein